MAAEYSQTTFFTSVGLGAVALSIITSAVTNSFFTKGDVVYDTTGRTDAPSIIVDTESFSTMISESCLATGTGGSSNYPTCEFTNPRSGSGVLTQLSIEAKGVATSTFITCYHGLAAEITSTATGSKAITNFNKMAFSTGVTIMNLTGAVILNANDIVHCATTVTPGTVDAKIKAVIRDIYSN